MQWYRDLRGSPLYSGLGDCPNTISSFPQRRRRVFSEVRIRILHSPGLCVGVNEASSFTEDRLYVVAIRIQHEGCVIPRRVAPSRRPGAPLSVPPARKAAAWKDSTSAQLLAAKATC